MAQWDNRLVFVLKASKPEIADSTTGSYLNSCFSLITQ